MAKPVVAAVKIPAPRSNTVTVEVLRTIQTFAQGSGGALTPETIPPGIRELPIALVEELEPKGVVTRDLRRSRGTAPFAARSRSAA
jgi:hypothetical protein